MYPTDQDNRDGQDDGQVDGQDVSSGASCNLTVRVGVISCVCVGCRWLHNGRSVRIYS